MISINKSSQDIPDILLSGFEKTWQDASVIDKLKEIYHGKCAYCETKTEDLQVDHYRPLSKYPWLANEWSNLLPACTDCQKSKGDQFPILGQQAYISSKKNEDEKAGSKLLLNEKPVLIHPEIDTAENHFYFEKNGIIQGNTERGRRTISILGLNRDKLVDARRKKYELLYEAAKNEIAGINKIIKIDSDLFRKLSIESSKQQEFTLLGRQAIFQFEDYILNDAFFELLDFRSDYIENAKNTLTEREVEQIDFFGEIEINYYDVLNIFNTIFFNLNIQQATDKLQLSVGIYCLKVCNFQGIKELQLTNIPLNTQWIFLTGENGFGKTSVLRALLLGLIGKSEFKESEIDENSRIEITLIEREKKFQTVNDTVRTNVISSNAFKPCKKVAAYGAKRTDFDPNAGRLSVADNLFDKNSYILNTEYLLKTLDGNSELEPFKEKLIECIKNLIPNLSKINFIANSTKTVKEVQYIEKDEFGNELPPVRFDQLAMGMRGIIGLVGDMVQRLSEGFIFTGNREPNTFEVFKDTFNSLSDLEGIVIIDEFDNHLHPKWQKMLVEKLTIMFPKVQFIVSTHSPIPMLGAPKNSVFIKIDRNKEQGITAEILDIDVSTLTPNSILTSPILGFDDIISKEADVDDISTEDDYNEIQRTKSLKEKLKILKQSDADFFNSLKAGEDDKSE
jgi:uncharacterized protein (TIGR02646 family)